MVKYLANAERNLLYPQEGIRRFVVMNTHQSASL